MKPTIKNLSLGAILGASLHLQAAPMLVPNGDFETPGGANWAEVSAGGTYVYSYPATGGNTGGYGVIDNSAADGGFGIWVANDNAEIPLASLGLTAGESYVFTQDMTILAGTTIGTFKVDFFVGGVLSGSTNDFPTTLIGDGTTWETYSYTVPIPAGTEGIKVVPVWGPGSSIGYDNVGVDNTPVETPLIPNGDFENGSASWFEEGAPNTTFSYPDSGGNPDGHGVMTNTAGSGSWVANGGAPLSLAALGLAGGDLVTFKQDMKILSGSNLGGLRIDFLAGATFLGDSGNLFPDLIGNGSTWETYSFDVPLPATADHIKLVPLSGSGSSIGFDNVTLALVPPPPFAVDFTLGTAVSWTAPSAINIYQPQKSDNNMDWMDLGPALDGDAVTTAFDPDGSAFYRVLESPVTLNNTVLNGGFETANPSDPMLANSWTPIGSQPPTRITSDFRTGTASMQILVQNDATPTANTSEIQQDIQMAGGTITAGETYDFSFWAKQVIPNGVSYVQRYRLQWLDGGGAIISEAFGFTDFSGGTGGWAEITRPGLVAPEGVATALIQIFGATGAVAGASAQGQVLIDDVALLGSATTPDAVEAVLNGAFEFEDPDNFDCAESWLCIGSQPPILNFFDSVSGIYSMQLKVQNDGTPTPNSSEIQQDILVEGGTITPGATYDFSFWANQVTNGVSYVQQYQVQWLNSVGAPLPGGIAFTPFTAGSGDWLQTKVEGLVAPAGAATALIQIVASTGAVASAAAEGEVLIDDVSLASPVTPTILPASSADGIEISWNSEVGKLYQPKSSPDLMSFGNFGPAIEGDGGVQSAVDVRTLLEKFYQVVETTP